MNKKSGFTIIEIALVLGIAGLIFIMAFIALPSLWASQHDADRRANVMSFISAIKNYQTNNSRGALPQITDDTSGYDIIDWDTAINGATYGANSWYGFIKDYVDINFRDPSGNKYTFYIGKCDANTGEACLNGSFNNINKNTFDINMEVDNTIYVAIGATCDGDQMVKASNNRSVAALQILERASRYCYNT